MLDLNEQELSNFQKLKGSDEIVKEYANKVCTLNQNLNFINDIGKEKEKEYEFNTAVYIAREEGIEQGIEQNRLENAASLIKNGFDKDEIIKALKLTEDEIKLLDL